MTGQTGTSGCRTYYLPIEKSPRIPRVFPPFELLYGRAVRGPLDILKESWKEPNKCGDNVVSYVLAMQDKLATMAEMVKGNLERAQQKQKLWYVKTPDRGN